MLSATADTNIYISGLNFGGEPRRFLNLAEAGHIRLAVSDSILTEISRVLGYERIGWPQERIVRTVRQIRRFADYVKPVEAVNVITVDPSDNRILECAVAAKSGYIVTGDYHLLMLKKYQGINIVKLARFLELLRNEPGTVC